MDQCLNVFRRHIRADLALTDDTAVAVEGLLHLPGTAPDILRLALGQSILPD